MTMCMIRVELHGASWADYTNLAAYLKNYGIVDVIEGSDRQRYKLPPAEYHYDGPKTLEQVYADTVTCTTMVGRTHAIVASEITRCKWVGLQYA